MPRAAIILCLVSGLMFTGCGFHLRGTSGIPEAIQPLSLECAQSVPDRVCRAVKQQLVENDVDLVGDDQASTRLKLSDFRQDRRANAVTARAAAAEYTLRHSVNMEVISANRTPLIATTRVDSADTYRYDETNILAKQREEEALQQSLAQQLAQQVIFRLTPLNQTRLDTIEAPSQ